MTDHTKYPGVCFFILCHTTKSLTELFQRYEVCFSGNKTPGWKDFVSFRPGQAEPPNEINSDNTSRPVAAAVTDDQGEHAPDADGNPKIFSDDDGGGGSSSGVYSAGSAPRDAAEPMTCRGTFWRSNGDGGTYTLEAVGTAAESEGPRESKAGDGGAPGSYWRSREWMLTLDWVKWDAEVVRLQDMGRERGANGGGSGGSDDSDGERGVEQIRFKGSHERMICVR